MAPSSCHAIGWALHTGDRDQQQSSAWNSRAAYQSSGSTWKGCGPASLRWNRADDDAAGKNSADHSFSAHHSSSTVREYKPWMSKGTDAGKESANSYSNHRLDTRAGSDKQVSIHARYLRASLPQFAISDFTKAQPNVMLCRGLLAHSALSTETRTSLP